MADILTNIPMYFEGSFMLGLEVVQHIELRWVTCQQLIRWGVLRSGSATSGCSSR